MTGPTPRTLLEVHGYRLSNTGEPLWLQVTVTRSAVLAGWAPWAGARFTPDQARALADGVEALLPCSRPGPLTTCADPSHPSGYGALDAEDRTALVAALREAADLA